MAAAEAEKALDLGWSFWATLCMATIVAAAVNQLEQPFARSIVTCDTPVDNAPGAPNPLSLKCGDRLYVIGEGARLSAKGQALENTCKVIMVVVTGVLADIFGRKPLAIVGIGSMCASVFLFVWASFDSSNASWLFIIAQGVQGFNGGDMVSGIIFADISLRLGANAADIFVKKDQILGLTAISTFLIAQVIAGLEIVDFSGIWLCVACLITMGMHLCVFRFPETKSKTNDSEGAPGFVQQLVAQLGLYRSMFTLKPFVFWSILQAFLAGPMDSGEAFFFPFMMSSFGYTQRMLVLRILPLAILSGVCTPFVNDYCKRVGYTRGFWRAMMALRFGSLTIFPLCITTWWMPWLAKIYYLPLAGFGPVWTGVRSRIVGEKMIAKYESLQFLTYFGSQAMGYQVRQMLFNERASTFWQRANSNVTFPTIFNIMDSLVMIFIVYPGCREALASMDAEQSAAGGDVTGKSSAEADQNAKKTE